MIGSESIVQTKVNCIIPDCSVRVWRHRNNVLHDGNVISTTAFNNGGATVLVAFIFNVVRLTCLTG